MASGEVKYRLTCENKDFRDAFKQAQEHVLSLGTAFTEFNQALELVAKVFDALKGAAAAAMVPLEKALDLADRLTNLSAKTGLTAESLQRLGAVGLTTGTSMETLGGAITKMQKGLVETPEAFTRMGLSAQKLIAMKPEEAFAKIAEKIGSIENPAQRTAAAIAAFGKGGAEMLPLLASNIKEVSDRAQELGLVMSNETVAALDAVGDQLDLTKAAGAAVVTNFGAMIGTSPGVGAAVRAVGDAFGILSAAVLKNKDGIHSLTSALAGGLVDAIRGSGTALVALASVAQTGLDVWAGLRLAWISASRGLYDLGIAFAYVAKAADFMSPLGSSQTQKWLDENIALLRGAKVAAEKEADAVVQGNTDKSNSLAVFRSAMEGVSAQLAQVGKATQDETAATKDQTGAYKSAADAARELAEHIADLAAVDREWAKQQKENAAAAKKDVADDVANFVAVSNAFAKMQGEMTLANTTGTQRRLAQAKLAYDDQLRAIAALKIKDASELNAMLALANKNYGQMKAAAMGYYSTAEQYAASLGIKTRAEQDATAVSALAGYNQMLASGLFTVEQLKVAWEKYKEATGEVHKAGVKTATEGFLLIADSASSMLRSLFGKNKKAAIAAAIIDIAAGVVKSFAQYGWPWGLVPAAAIVAAGVVQIGKINSSDPGFRQGTPGLGFVDFGPATPTVLHGREAVVPEGRAREFAAMHGGGGRGGAGGGGGVIHNVLMLDSRVLAETWKKLDRTGMLGAT